jgi:mannosyltransferase OCH1-like enzyme
MKYNYIYIIILILILIGGLLYYQNIQVKKENLENYTTIPNITNNQDKTNQENNSEIPLHIYQTWHSNQLPKYMQECVDKLKKDNPEFEYHFYDDNQCREYIKDNFNKDVLHAFDKLIPGAFKADLWRYCILYKKLFYTIFF